MPRCKLTARYVESVKTDKPQEEHRDVQERGLELRVTRAGVKAWAFRYRRKSDGRKRVVTLGRFPEVSLEEGRTRAREARAAVSRGADPASGVKERRIAPTFADLVAEWQTTHAELNRSGRVRADDRSILKLYILPAIGDMKAHEIGRREISLMLSHVISAIDCRKGHRQGAPRRLTHRANSVFALLRSIMRWAVAQGIILTDPTYGMKKPIKKTTIRDRELSPAEIEILWRNLDHLPGSLGLRIAIKLSLATAQRIGEVCGIHKRELVLDGAMPVWVLPRERAKNGEGHRVPLSPLAVSLLREAIALQDGNDEALSPWVFPARAKRDGSHGPIEGHSAAVAMFRGRHKLGVAHFRIHDLRRTAATRMAEMGINPYTISLVLNHVSASKSTVTSKVYIQYSFDREKREALNAWGARLEEIVDGKLSGQVNDMLEFNVVRTGRQFGHGADLIS